MIGIIAIEMSSQKSTTDVAMLDQPRGGEEKSSQLSLLEMKSFDFRYPFARSDLLNNNHEVSCLSGLALKLASFEQEGINQCPSILDAFNHELPDPNQELFLQFDPMFTCFERLPIEIRREIWLLRFPRPRRVNLFNPCNYLRCVRRYQVSYPFLPNTLRINAEARRETLRYYTIIMPEDVSYSFGRSIRKPLCFSPRRDLFYTQACCDTGLVELEHFINHIQEKTNGSLSRISSIEYTKLTAMPAEFARLKRHAGFPWTAEECMKPKEAPEMRRYYNGYIMKETPLKGLLALKGLRNLTFRLMFIGCHYPQWPLGSSPTHDVICSQFEEVLIAYFEKNKHHFDDGMAPRVTVVEDLH